LGDISKLGHRRCACDRTRILVLGSLLLV
jgi:hypothetical protein